ncbi:hypothetical protein MIR68_006899 [Amoeboaphelidium protococcarum]|nr:hypothetical protein MIR68_006899 [Amoeboaphelidium protococcarum]
MGGDGGFIAKRSEIVKLGKGQRQQIQSNVSDYRYCSLSHEELRDPIVSCKRGKLYNKEAVVKYILDKRLRGQSKVEGDSAKIENTEQDIVAGHIKRLKDVTDLKLTRGDDGRVICPVTRRQMNGLTKFVYMKPCGCVVSQIAVDLVPSATDCVSCGANVIKVVPIKYT